MGGCNQGLQGQTRGTLSTTHDTPLATWLGETLVIPILKQFSPSWSAGDSEVALVLEP